MAQQDATQQQDTRPITNILDSENFTASLDDDTLAKIGLTCMRGYEMDLASVSDRMETLKELNQIARQAQEKKTYPWPGASNVKYPMILEAALQFNGRAYPVILNNGDIAKIAVSGDDDEGVKQARAGRVGKHMSHQITEEMDGWEAGMDWLLISLPIVGVVFKKVWFDGNERKNASEVVGATDLIVNNSTKTFKSCPRASHIVAFYPYEIRENIAMGLWRDAKISIADEDTQTPEEFIEQHTLIDLDGDEYPEPYIVTIHKATGKAVRVEPNFDADNVIMDDEAVVKINAKKYFVKYECFPDPEGGFYGVGLGQLLKPLNDSVDSILNQMIDAGHLANTGGGFLGKGFKFKSGSVRVSPGEWKKTDIQGGVLRDNIMPLPVPQPSAVLFSLLGLLIDAGKDIASIQDVLTGGGGKNMPATSVLALIEQGMKVYTAIFKRIYRSLKEELRLIYELNQDYLTVDEYQTFLDDPEYPAIQQAYEASGQVTSVVADYEGQSKDIRPEADPSMATDMQKMAKAEFMLAFKDDPRANGQEIILNSWKAAGIDDPEQFMAPPQEGPSPGEMIELARLELEKTESARKASETHANNIKTFTEALKNIAETDEKGADNELNTAELTILYENLVALGEELNEQTINEQIGVSGLEGNSGVPVGPPETGPV